MEDIRMASAPLKPWPDQNDNPLLSPAISEKAGTIERYRKKIRKSPISSGFRMRTRISGKSILTIDESVESTEIGQWEGGEPRGGPAFRAAATEFIARAF